MLLLLQSTAQTGNHSTAVAIIVGVALAIALPIFVGLLLKERALKRTQVDRGLKQKLDTQENTGNRIRNALVTLRTQNNLVDLRISLDVDPDTQVHKIRVWLHDGTEDIQLLMARVDVVNADKDEQIFVWYDAIGYSSDHGSIQQVEKLIEEMKSYITDQYDSRMDNT